MHSILYSPIVAWQCSLMHLLFNTLHTAPEYFILSIDWIKSCAAFLSLELYRETGSNSTLSNTSGCQFYSSGASTAI